MPAIESEAKARTKARFEEVFSSYSALSEVKKKSKRTQPEEHVLLETLKKSVSKDGSRESIPSRINKWMLAAEQESSVSGKELKQPKTEKKKKKTEADESAVSNESQPVRSELGQKQDIAPFSVAGEHPLKLVKKKSKAIHGKESYPTDYDDEDQLIEAYRLQVSQEETNEIKEKIKKKLQAHLFEHFSSDENQHTLHGNQDEKKKKRKKKKDAVESEPETSVMSLSELQEPPADIVAQPLSQPSLEDLEKPEELYKRKGKKAKKKTHSDEVIENNTEEADGQQNSHKCVYDDSLVLGIYIHRADKLKTDLITSRPMVKIYIIDQNTGEYFKKSYSTDAVSSLHEREKNEYVLPMYTQPYDFKRLKTVAPEWDEQIIINEQFINFLHSKDDGPDVIIFFEILDLLNEDGTVGDSSIQIKEKGFHKIAWAFLKIVGANDVLNVDKKLRLQLYHPPRSRIASSTHVCDWWLKYPRNRYPSTLYVTIKGLKLPDNANSNIYMGLPLAGSPTHADLKHDVCSDSGETKQKKEPFKWTRLPGQACRIPNRQCLSLRAGHMGCSFVCFSNEGRKLVAACANRDGYPLNLYEIPSGQYLKALHGHLNVVYDLCWSSDDQQLLSASSDATVRLWRVALEASSAFKVLPHPTFVYTAKFHPLSDDLVVSGCYDSVIRLWNVKVKEINGQLLQEFEGHTGFINTLCFDTEGLHMFSGDSTGLVIVWNSDIRRSWQHNPAENWTILKEIKEPDMKGIAVNHLQVHPNGRRLLIHLKDSTLRIMDLRILAAKKYIGATNYKEKLNSAFTPCGTFVIAGSEDGIAYVWNAETGDQVAKYSKLSYTAPLRGVAFHPHEHMVAFCSFGQNQPILVYIYDYKVAQSAAESAHISSDVSDASHSDVFTFQDSVIAVRSSMRMMKVKQKLDSVLNGSNPMLPEPSLLSPHSKLRFTQGSSIQLQPAGTSSSDGFSPVGQPLSRTPSIRLQMINSEAKVSSLKVEADSGLPIQETVVALYDYTAHRSDELSLHRSDIIHVLYKDNDNWWFGILRNGQQGYFPANYVAAESSYDEIPTTSKSQYADSPQDLEGPNQSPYRMSEVPGKSKDLKFMSQHDTHADSPVTHSRTRLRTQQMTELPDTSSRPVALQTGSSTSEQDLPRHNYDSKPKKKKSFKLTPTVGKTNVAFQVDE